jgi:hypothetical protein
VLYVGILLRRRYHPGRRRESTDGEIAMEFLSFVFQVYLSWWLLHRLV